MNKLPKASQLSDGSLVIPPETRELLYRVLGDVKSTLFWTNGMERMEPPQTLEMDGVPIYEHGGPVILDHDHELMAIDELENLVGAKNNGMRLRPLYKILGVDPPAFKPPPSDDDTPSTPGPLRRVK